MLEAILAALHASMQTIERIGFYSANWNKNEAIKEIVKMVANAQKLEWCYINGQINTPRIRLSRRKAGNGVSGTVKAIQQGTRKVICEKETALS